MHVTCLWWTCILGESMSPSGGDINGTFNIVMNVGDMHVGDMHVTCKWDIPVGNEGHMHVEDMNVGMSIMCGTSMDDIHGIMNMGVVGLLNLRCMWWTSMRTTSTSMWGTCKWMYVPILCDRIWEFWNWQKNTNMDYKSHRHTNSKKPSHVALPLLGSSPTQ